MLYCHVQDHYLNKFFDAYFKMSFSDYYILELSKFEYYYEFCIDTFFNTHKIVVLTYVYSINDNAHIVKLSLYYRI